MARHAGFAVAVSVDEAFINQSISAAFADLSPLSHSQLFAVPSSVPVIGGATARLSGIGMFEARPQVRLVANPANTVNMAASAIVFVTGTTHPTLPMIQVSETWKVRLTGTAAVGIDVDVAPDGIFLRWVPSVSSIGSLSIAVLDGPPPPQWLLDALNSPQVRNAMTLAIQQVRPVRITPKLMDRTLQHVQAGDFPSTGVSLFQWFVINETISRAVVRIHGGAVSVGIDLHGRTLGDPNQLVNLRHHVGDGVIYRWRVRDNPAAGERPLLIPSGPQPGRGDIAVLVNSNVLSAIVADVSAQIANTPIAPGIRIMSVGLRPSFFIKPLRGREIGLRVDVTVHHHVAGNVTGTLYLQPYLMVDARGVANPFPERWLIHVGHVEVNVPWWVDIAVVVTGLALSTLFPPLAPLLLIGVIAAIDGIIPGAIHSATGQALAAQGAGYGLAQGSKSSTLPTQKHQPSWEILNWIAVSSEGVDLRMSIVAPSVRFGSIDDTADVARLICDFRADRKGPYRAEVQLRPDLMSLAANCEVQLVVTRLSDGDTVAISEGPYRTHRVAAFGHLTQELYHEDVFTVHARIWLNQASLTGLLFSADVDVTVTDIMDRHRPFVTWDAHWAHFRNAGTGWQWWHRFSSPKLHRTAVSARCAAVRRAAQPPNPGPFGPGLRYTDELEFDWSEVPAHRRQLCDHCFFGGPTSVEVSPREDWFTNRFKWPMRVLTSTPTDAVGPQAVLGRPNGSTWTVKPGESATFTELRRLPGLDLAHLLRPGAIIAGDVPTPRDLVRAHVVAFERNGNSPAAGGGWESCAFIFEDGVSAVTVNWDGRAGAARDRHVLANGSIRGRDYINHFKMTAQTPDQQIGDTEVISFLLFNLSDLQTESPEFLITVAGRAPGAGEEVTPDVDAIAFLESQG